MKHTKNSFKETQTPSDQTFNQETFNNEINQEIIHYLSIYPRAYLDYFDNIYDQKKLSRY